MIRTFKDNPKKKKIRDIDDFFIQEEFMHHKKKLKYFGLPSEGLYDIQQWDEYIGDIIAVERGSRSEPVSKQSLLMTNAFLLEYHSRLLLLRGDIFEIILNDEDNHGKKIPYPFELINLDYGGSILYPDRKRILALKKLIDCQVPNDFLLLITANSREFDEDELLNTQKRILAELYLNEDIQNKFKNFLEWINSKKSIHRQIMHLNYLLKCDAEVKHYNIECKPPTIYENEHHTLIHYIYKFRFDKLATTKITSKQTILDILKIEILKLENGNLRSIKSFKDFLKDKEI